MNNCTLSIIIPVYNVEKYIHECVNSITSQINEEFEAIFVDDGSTDSSGSICDDLCNEYSCFRVIHKTNGGLSDARNVGINASSGKYIMFLDSDDKLSPGCITEILEIIKGNSNDIYMGRTVTFTNDTNPTKKYNIDSYDNYKNIEEPSKVFVELDKNRKFWFAAWLIIIKRQFLLDNSLFFEKGLLHEDERWVPLVFANADTVHLFDLAFYMYRTNREGSIVSAPSIKREFDKIKTAEFFCEYSNNNIVKYNLLKRRAAALIFGVILSIENYKNSEYYKILLDKITSNLHVLDYGKYKFIAMLCRLFGVEKISSFIHKIV